jgi:hypothetical protein
LPLRPFCLCSTPGAAHSGEKPLTQPARKAQLPALIEAPAFDPVFLRWFAPGERVIWAGRSRGFDFSTQQWLVLAIYVLVAIVPVGFAISGRGTSIPWLRDLGLAVFAAIWLFGLIHAWWTLVTSPFNAEAVLTDRRLYIRKGMIRRPIRRLGGPADRISLRIRMLRLTGPADAPLLHLRGFMSNYTGSVALRIDQPYERAQLIKSTLNLAIPIKDRTHH